MEYLNIFIEWERLDPMHTNFSKSSLHKNSKKKYKVLTNQVFAHFEFIQPRLIFLLQFEETVKKFFLHYDYNIYIKY